MNKREFCDALKLREELLRNTAKTCQFMTKRYYKNELKHSKRFDHVTDDVMSLFWS